jgi:hypothetical protein
LTTTKIKLKIEFSALEASLSVESHAGSEASALRCSAGDQAVESASSSRNGNQDQSRYHAGGKRKTAARGSKDDLADRIRGKAGRDGQECKGHMPDHVVCFSTLGGIEAFGSQRLCYRSRNRCHVYRSVGYILDFETKQ